MSLDHYDLAILRKLQCDGRISNRDLAASVGLSAAPCWRRVKQLEEQGYIKDYVALIDRRKVNLQILVFAEVTLDNHHHQTIAAFKQLLQTHEEILECHKVSGQCDYLLKIVARDIEAYEYFLSHRLLQVSGIRSVNTMFSLKQPKIKRTLPLG